MTGVSRGEEAGDVFGVAGDLGRERGACYAYRCMVHSAMIRSFRNRGLKRLYERNDVRGIKSEQLTRIEDILGHLDVAVKPVDLDLPGYRLHPLKGNLKGFWSVLVSGNWRVIFRMVDGDAYDVDLIDYH